MSTKTKDVLSLKPKEVRDNLDKLQGSLAKAIDFLSTQLHIDCRELLPHSQQIVPVTYFFSKQHSPTSKQDDLLKKWFWKTSFSTRYSASTDRKMNEDIVFMDQLVNNNFSGIDKYSHTTEESDLTDTKFSKNSPLTRAFLLLMAQKNPLNLTNANLIDLGIALSEYNQKEYHHIFPKKHLKTRGYDTNKINSLSNFCFLPSESNKRISGKSPSEYVFTLIPEEKYQNILSSNLMPLDKNIYQKNDYESFLTKRAQIIIQYLETLIT